MCHTYEWGALARAQLLYFLFYDNHIVLLYLALLHVLYVYRCKRSEATGVIKKLLLGSVRTLCAWPLHHPQSAGDTSGPTCLRHVRSQMGSLKISYKDRWYMLTCARGLALLRGVVPLTRISPCWAEPPSKLASPLFHPDLATSLFDEVL